MAQKDADVLQVSSLLKSTCLALVWIFIHDQVSKRSFHLEISGNPANMLSCVFDWDPVLTLGFPTWSLMWRHASLIFPLVSWCSHFPPWHRGICLRQRLSNWVHCSVLTKSGFCAAEGLCPWGHFHGVVGDCWERARWRGVKQRSVLSRFSLWPSGGKVPEATAV